MTDWEVEVLLDAPTEVSTTLDPTYSIEVVLGDAVLVGEMPGDLTIEIVEPLPDMASYIEPMDFTYQGQLAVVTGVSERPIVGGTFTIASIAGHVAVPPSGASVILDVLKNGVSIFTVPGNRPT